MDEEKIYRFLHHKVYSPYQSLLKMNLNNIVSPGVSPGMYDMG